MSAPINIHIRDSTFVYHWCDHDKGGKGHDGKIGKGGNGDGGKHGKGCRDDPWSSEGKADMTTLVAAASAGKAAMATLGREILPRISMFDDCVALASARWLFWYAAVFASVAYLACYPG